MRRGIHSRIHVRKYTCAARDSKLRNLASHFGKLLEVDFCLFCQILKDGKSYTKLLEMLQVNYEISYLFYFRFNTPYMYRKI